MSEDHESSKRRLDGSQVSGSLEERIAETSRSLDFTRKFLEQLDSSDDSTRQHISEIAHSLERELDRLRTSAERNDTPKTKHPSRN